MELDRIAVEFDGEDAMKPKTRQVLDACRHTLLWLSEFLSAQGRSVELIEPPEEEAREFRDAVERRQHLAG
jgi:hypothetical protein